MVGLIDGNDWTNFFEIWNDTLSSYIGYGEKTFNIQDF